MYNNKAIQKIYSKPGKTRRPSADLAAIALFCAAAMAGTASAQPPGENIIDVKVYFDGDCPRYVDKWDVQVQRDEPQKPAVKIRWTAYNLDGSMPLEDVSYDIYFDPFVGPGSESNRKGVVKSRPIKPHVPVGVSYKYTILADDCPEGLDPLIRVR